MLSVLDEDMKYGKSGNMQTVIVNSQRRDSGRTSVCAHLSVEAARAGDGPVFALVQNLRYRSVRSISKGTGGRAPRRMGHHCWLTAARLDCWPSGLALCVQAPMMMMTHDADVDGAIWRRLRAQLIAEFEP
jgi:hypothetical protein